MSLRLLPIGLAAFICCAAPAALPAKEAAPAAKNARMATATLTIEGMHCQGCAMMITQKLEKLKGVKVAKVDFDKREAFIQFDPSRCKPDDLVAAVKQAGYKATVKT
jgi:copper chaperone CopZ